MYSQARMRVDILARRIPSQAIWLLVGALFVLSTQAKLCLYHEDGTAKYLNNAAKMKECRAETGEVVLVTRAFVPCPDTAAREVSNPVAEVALPSFFSLVRPFQFRPPPADL
jgi:hypothetical protein